MGQWGQAGRMQSNLRTLFVESRTEGYPRWCATIPSCLPQAIEDIGPRRGACRIGIADLMKEADLTVGGFYKHFKNA